MDIHGFFLYLKYLCIRVLFLESNSTPSFQSGSLLYGFQGQETWKLCDITKTFLENEFKKYEFFNLDSTDFDHSQIFLLFSKTGYSTIVCKGSATIYGKDLSVFLEIQFNLQTEEIYLIRLKEQNGDIIAEREF